MARAFSVSFDFKNKSYTAIVTEGEKHGIKTCYKVSIFDEELQYHLHNRELTFCASSLPKLTENPRTPAEELTNSIIKAICTHLKKGNSDQVPK